MNQKVDAPYDFIIYAHGLVYSSVCTSLPREQVAERVNLESPTGLSHGWQIADEDFASGEPNGTPCPDNPETHRHWLVVC